MQILRAPEGYTRLTDSVNGKNVYIKHLSKSNRGYTVVFDNEIKKELVSRGYEPISESEYPGKISKLKDYIQYYSKDTVLKRLENLELSRTSSDAIGVNASANFASKPCIFCRLSDQIKRVFHIVPKVKLVKLNTNTSA